MNGEELQEKITKIVSYYITHREKMRDDEIEELRAQLATAAYLFVEEVVEPTYEYVLEAIVALDKVEGELFIEYFKQFKDTEKYSASIAETMARKATKADERWLEALGNHTRAKSMVDISNKLLLQMNQVLNSMAKRNRLSA